LGGALLQPASARPAQNLPDCSAMVSPDEMRKNDWISFHDGRVLRIDLRDGLLAVDFEGKHYESISTGTLRFATAASPERCAILKWEIRSAGLPRLLMGEASL
jgi:hypothetical protein